jgi:SAM-dependent methyltransferase
MLETILPYLRCPGCGATDLRRHSTGIACPPCGKSYPLHEGILDLSNARSSEVITPFQRIMQTPLVVSIYERFWRRLGYLIASSRSFERELQTVLKLQRGGETDRVLDLACGTGVFTRPLARQTRGVVVGLDLSKPMLLQARRLLDRDGVHNVVLIRGTAYQLPFIASAFSCVNCCGALHLFDQPDAALKEIRRVLAPSGSLSVQTTIRPQYSWGMAYFLERWIRFGFFQEGELRDRIRLHGLKILESERHRISFTFLARRIF